MTEQTSGRKTQAVIMGIDWARGRDVGVTVYYCRECGNIPEPCSHLDAYVKAQRRDVEIRRLNGMTDADRSYNKKFQERVKKWSQ